MVPENNPPSQSNKRQVKQQIKQNKNLGQDLQLKDILNLLAYQKEQKRSKNNVLNLDDQELENLLKLR